MCTEADALLGRLLNALGEAKEDTFVVFVSDHGEDNTEHRQQGKNNMYDSGSRVATMLAGPGVAPAQVFGPEAVLASLNDVFPTVLDMASQPLPAGLAGSSLLRVASLAPSVGAVAAARLAGHKAHVAAQYHSVFSVTGQFMLRHGSMKLIAFGDMPAWEAAYPPQLFDLAADPWELHDLAPAQPQTVAALRQLLDAEFDADAADAAAKGDYYYYIIIILSSCSARAHRSPTGRRCCSRGHWIARQADLWRHCRSRSDEGCPRHCGLPQACGA